MGNLKIYINCLCGNCVHQIFGIVWYCLMWFYEVEIFQDRKEVEADLVVDVTVSGYDHRITIQACTGLTWPPFPPLYGALPHSMIHTICTHLYGVQHSVLPVSFSPPELMNLTCVVLKNGQNSKIKK